MKVLFTIKSSKYQDLKKLCILSSYVCKVIYLKRVCWKHQQEQERKTRGSKVNQ